jgi:hypothetical protein
LPILILKRNNAMKRKKAMKKSGLRKRRTGKSAHSYGKLETKRCLASVGLDGALTCDIGDAAATVEQAAFEDTIEGRSGTTLRDRVVERLSNRDPSATPGGGAIREIAQRIAEHRGEQASMEGLKELVSTAREDGEVTEEERAEIRELVSTELAERGRDGSNLDPERQERRQERREERREQRDSDVDSQRREQLRERISARRAVSSVFGRLLRG